MYQVESFTQSKRWNMADVKPELSSGGDSITSQEKSINHKSEMTVEKADKTEPVSSNDTSKLTPAKTKNNDALLSSPGHPKTATESISSPSSNKSESKPPSPSTKASSNHRSHTSSNTPKNSPRKNPWNRNPPVSNKVPEAKQVSMNSNKQQLKDKSSRKDSPTKGIQIPKVSAIIHRTLFRQHIIFCVLCLSDVIIRVPVCV